MIKQECIFDNLFRISEYREYKNKEKIIDIEYFYYEDGSYQEFDNLYFKKYMEQEKFLKYANS